MNAPRADTPRSHPVGSSMREPLDTEPTQIDFRAIFGVLRRRFWTMLGTVFVVLAMTFIAVSQMDKRYSAETLVVVDQRDSRLVGFDASFTQGFGGSTIVDTEVEIARSSRVMERAAEALNLLPTAPAGGANWLLSLVGIGDGKEGLVEDDRTFQELNQAERNAGADRLSTAVEVSRRGITNVIAIHATASSPRDAAARANAVADAYLEEQIAGRIEAADRARAFLSRRVDELETDIAAAEYALEAFIDEKIRELGSPSAQGFVARIAEEQAARDAGAARLAEIRRALADDEPALLAQFLEGPHLVLAQQRSDLVRGLETGGGGFDLAEARRRLDELDESIRLAAVESLTSLETDLSLSASRANGLRRQLEAALADLQLPRDVTADLIRLRREAETRRGLYETFATRLQEVEQQVGFDIPDSRVIAQATPPPHPSFPPTRLIFLGAILLAVGAGTGMAFLQESFVGGVTDVAQLERISEAPVVAVVPRGSSSTAPDRAIVEQPFSANAEAVRRLQLGTDTLAPVDPRCIMVTSAMPQDGKTTLALALARQFARTGHKTLLVDADLRHPSVHRILGVETSRGLASFLGSTEMATDTQLPVTNDPHSNVHIVLGEDPNDAATDALLRSDRLTDLVAFARQTYNVVIFDTSPIGLVVDASLVARHCDAGVFVARYGATNPQQIRSCMRDLRQASGAEFGVVLNQAPNLHGYGSGYGNYREYYRGDH